MKRSLTILSLGLSIGGGLVLTAVVAGSLSMAATAEPARPKAPHRFEMMDTNKDGVIDRSEAGQRLSARFDTLDADHDGKLTKAELKAGRSAQKAERSEKRTERRLARLDTDRNGQVSWDEAQAAAKSRFEAADANHDGVLDRDEVKAMHHRPHGKGMKSDGAQMSSGR